MKIVKLNNAVQVTGCNLEDNDDCIELGHILANECVVYVKDSVTEERLYNIHELWGQPSFAIIHRYVSERRLSGRHWRNLLLNLGYASTAVDHFANKSGMSRVSFEKNKRGKPTGNFTNGELDWHSDQQAYHDNHRVVGLMSLWGTKNSQTSFLCTAEPYENLNHEDKSMVDELVTVWNWDGGKMAPDLVPNQREIVHYNIIPYPNMECALVDQTATGIKGIRFPSHCFSHFKGMSTQESQSYKKHLWGLLNTPENIYTHDWEDGEIVFMDQNITLHARPTNIKDGNKRTLCRMISYLDKLYPGHGPADHVLYDGKKLDHETFANMVDEQRKSDFYAQIS